MNDAGHILGVIAVLAIVVGVLIVVIGAIARVVQASLRAGRSNEDRDLTKHGDQP